MWKDKEDSMLWTIAVVLFVLWALGLFAFNVGGGLIHVLIVAAVIILIFQLLSGRRSVI
jgi:hypothetical protein